MFTGAVPFIGRTIPAAVAAIMIGDRPSRPTYPILTDELWALIQRCWHPDLHLRPEVSEVLDSLCCS